MKNLFLVLVAVFTMSAVSAQTIAPSVNLDVSNNTTVEVGLSVSAGSTVTIPFYVQDALGLVLGLVSNINVNVSGSTNFQVSNVHTGLLGILLGSFQVTYTANLPAGSEETADISVSVNTGLLRASTSVGATSKIRMRIL